MNYIGYTKIVVSVTEKVVTAVFDNPPMNLIDDVMFTELGRLTEELADDHESLVVVFKSADPDFFIAHAELDKLNNLDAIPVKNKSDPSLLNELQAMCERVRTMNLISIAQVEGRAGGGGAELAMACDMRFGVKGKTVFNNPGVAVGTIPGGGGTQNMPRLIGRARAMEAILGALDLDAETAEKWGYLNRALAADEIDPFVVQVARRIATSPPLAVKYAKQSITLADLPHGEGLREENRRFAELLVDAPYISNSRRFLELGAQTRDGEMNMTRLLDGVREGNRW